MSLKDDLKEKMSLKEQLRSVIEWRDPDPELLFERWTDNGDEIKNASKLIVGPGQGCIFVYQGAVEDVIEDEGLVELETENISFWTTITKFMQNFESHHKVGLYFFRKAHMLNRRWGTPAPIKYSDPKYNFPVALGAFGNYSTRITKGEDFFRKVVAGARAYPIAELHNVFLSRITQPMSDFLAKAAFSYVEIDAHREDIASAVRGAVSPIFDDLGFELLDFRIEGTNFDEETQERIGRIADMSAETQAASAAGIDYTEHQKLQAMRDVAKNEGLAGMGLQMGMGMGLGKMFGEQVGQRAGEPEQKEPPETARAPSPAAGGSDPTARLAKLKNMFDGDLIDEEEYKAKKAEILADL